MIITCRHCKGQFRVSDENLPPGGTMTPCPNCKRNIRIQGEKRFDPDAPPAMVCVRDETAGERVKTVLCHMNYTPHVAESTGDVVEKMRFHRFGIIVMSDDFDGAVLKKHPAMQHIHSLPMDIRRHMVVALLTNTARTMDRMAAYHLSVNVVIHPGDLGKLEQILNRGIGDSASFYQIYREVVAKV